MRIMCCGDSITCGVPQFEGGYRRYLANSAPGLEFVGSIVYNITDGTTYTVGQHEGYSGKRIADLQTNSVPQADIYLPDIVLLMIGTNDLAPGTADPAAVMTLAQSYLAKASVSKVIVSTIAPLPDTSAYQQTGIDFNAGLVAEFASPPSGIYFYDCCQDLIQTSDFANTLHPNEGGYVKIATRWNDALIAADVDPAFHAPPGARYGGIV